MTVAPRLSSRATWHVRASAVVAAWLLAAAGAWLLHDSIDQADWLVVHLLMLGAVTSALLIWTRHFTLAILRQRGDASRRPEAARLVLLNVGAVLVIAGVIGAHEVVVASGALVVGSAISWHGLALVSGLRRALPSRFAMTVHAYVAAGALLLPGVVLGVLLARIGDDDPLHERLLIAHVSLNLLGWVGVPILATLVTLWPTMLKTRLSGSAEQRARLALPWLVGGTLAVAVGSVADLPALALVGMAGYLVGLSLTLVPMLEEMRRKPPASFATWSTLAGTTWITGSLVAVAVMLARDPSALHEADGLGIALLVGGVLQVLLGALSYLLPVMAGGGPAALRARDRRADRMAGGRLVVVNASLALVMLPISAGAHALLGYAVVAGLLSTLACIASTMRVLPSDHATVDNPSLADAVTWLAAQRGSALAGAALVLVLNAFGTALLRL